MEIKDEDLKQTKSIQVGDLFLQVSTKEFGVLIHDTYLASKYCIKFKNGQTWDGEHASIEELEKSIKEDLNPNILIHFSQDEFELVLKRK